MYDINDFVYPINLDYDREYLHWVCKNIKHWPMYSADRGKTFFSDHNDIFFPANVEAIKVKNKILHSTTFSFSFVPPGKETGWHVDEFRGCTLMCPLDTEPHLIKFDIDGKEIDYFYDTPTLTNGIHWHNGINHTKENRYNLLFHFDKDYKEIKQLNDNDDLVFRWQQDYNICQFYDNDVLQKYFNTHQDIDNCNILITDKDIDTECTVIFIGDTHKEYDHNILCNDKMSVVQAVKQILDSPVKIKRIEYDV